MVMAIWCARRSHLWRCLRPLQRASRDQAAGLGSVVVLGFPVDSEDSNGEASSDPDYTGEASATTTTDAVAPTTTSPCRVPVAATMKREDEEAIVHGKDTKVTRVHAYPGSEGLPASVSAFLPCRSVENNMCDNVLE